MKQLIWIIILIGLIVQCHSNFSPVQPFDKDEARRIAWESLSEQEQSTVIHPWNEALVKRTTWWKTGQSAICVYFNTIDDALLGPIMVYLDTETLELLGFGFRY